MPREPTKNQNIIVLKYRLLLLYKTPKKTLLDRILMCNKMWILWQLVATSSVVGWRRSSKALPKAKLAPKKAMVTVWWSAAHLIPYSFLNPRETLHLRSALSKPMRCTETCDACSRHSSAAGRSPFPRQCLPHVAQPTLQKLSESGCEVLPHPPYSQDLPPTDYHFFKHRDHFLQGKHFRDQQEADDAFLEFIRSPGTDLYTTGINKLTSSWQECVDYNGSYFD